MKLHPIEFLLKQLLEYENIPGYINDEVMEYLDNYDCCAFCESCHCPNHDNCHGLDFNNHVCGYYHDTRKEHTCFSITDFYRSVLEQSKIKKENEE